MSFPDRPVLLTPILLAGSVLITCIAVTLAALPWVVRMLLPALMALGVGWALFARAVGAERREAALTASRAATAEARVALLTQDASQMRHDLRGILSPAMLTADRLTNSQDPLARRAGEAMISTVERAEERLRREPASSRKVGQAGV